MTRYELLLWKADNCLSAAMRVGSDTYMGSIWLSKKARLEEMAMELSLAEASEIVGA